MYCDPLRGGKFYNEQKTELQIQQKEVNVWDLTPIWGSSVLAASMQGSLTSPATPWFDIGFGNEDLENHREAKSWLDDCAKRMYDELQESNFYVEMASAYLDLVHYGNTGFTLETESDLYWSGLDFTSIAIRALYFEQDWDGKILVLYKRLEMSAAQILDKWGEAVKARLVEYIRVARERNKQPAGTDYKYDIIYCVFPRPKLVAKQKAEYRKPVAERENMFPLSADKRPYGAMYVFREDASMIGEEGGYYEMPAFLARWERTSGSMWGHGPSALALPTIQYLNAWLETEMAAAEKVADPAILSTERGVISQLDLRPGGNTVVRSVEDVVPFESKAQFPVVERRIEDLRDMIRKVYKVDDLQLKESPAMTAAEVERWWELMNRVLGATVTRLQSDLLSPLVERTFNIMYRGGRFKKAPASVTASDPHLRVHYRGPFMRAQRADEVGALERLAGVVASLAQQGFPQAVDFLDPLELVKKIVDRLSLPPDILKSDSDIQKMAQLRAQAVQQQMKQQQAETDATQASAAKSKAEAASTVAATQAGPQAAGAGSALLGEAGATSAPNPLRGVA
jgi:hypothetical protein